MIVGSRYKRNYLFNIMLSFIPEILLCLIATVIFAEDWIIFIFLYFGLKAIQLIVWVAKSIWGWIVFFLFGKKNMAQSFSDLLADHNFPDPGDYVSSSEDYFTQIMDNKEYDTSVRINAATALGELSGYRTMGEMQFLTQVRMAFDDAIVQHHRLLQLR